MGGIRKLPDAHIAHLVRVPHNILINFQFQIIQAVYGPKADVLKSDINDIL